MGRITSFTEVGRMEIPTETIDDIVALRTSVRELTDEQENGLID